MKNQHAKQEETPNEAQNAPPPEEKQQAEKTAEKELTPEEKSTQKIAAQEQEIADLKAKILYLQADYQNYRKRTAKDISDARGYGQSSTLEPFLDIYNFLGMAKTASEKSDNIDSIRQGLDMIISQFMKTFDEIGVKKFDTVGTAFDPNLHDAVAHEHSDSVPEGKIIKEWSGGYKLGEHLLRPARVVVSAGPDTPKREDTKAEESQSDSQEK